MNELTKTVLTDDETTLRDFAKRCAPTMWFLYVHDRAPDLDAELTPLPIDTSWESCAEKARAELATVKAMTDEEKHAQWREHLIVIAEVSRESAESFNKATVRLNRMHRLIVAWDTPPTSDMLALRDTMLGHLADARPTPPDPITPPTLEEFYAGLVESKQRNVDYFEERAQSAIDIHKRAVEFVKQFNESFPPPAT